MLLETFNFLKLRLEGDKEESSPSLEYSNVEIPLLPLNRTILNVPQEELYYEELQKVPLT
jgi:hypothetical protein